MPPHPTLSRETKVGYTCSKTTILAPVRLTQRIVVVGGGVLGTMHAVMARRRGYEVVHLEREAEARGYPRARRAHPQRTPDRAAGGRGEDEPLRIRDFTCEFQ